MNKYILALGTMNGLMSVFIFGAIIGIFIWGIRIL